PFRIVVNSEIDTFPVRIGLNLINISTACQTSEFLGSRRCNRIGYVKLHRTPIMFAS
ncbi:unnamed protein product, partial [Nesidiocoris tenuis]